MEPGATALASAGPRLLVQVGHHQHQTAVSVLDHRRQNTLREIRFHCLISKPRSDSVRLTPDIDTSPKWKMDAARAASAPPKVNASCMCCAFPAPPEAITGTRTADVTARSNSRSSPLTVR